MLNQRVTQILHIPFHIRTHPQRVILFLFVDIWHHRFHDLRHHLLPLLFSPQFLPRPTKATPWICQLLEGQKSLLPLRKENTVLTITFAFIAVNQDTELWIIKLRFNGSTSLHQLQLLRHQQKFRLPLKPPLLHNNREKFKPCIQSFAKTITFFYFCFNFNTSKFSGSFR